MIKYNIDPALSAAQADTLASELTELKSAIDVVKNDYLSYEDSATSAKEILQYEKLKAIDAILNTEDAYLMMNINLILTDAAVQDLVTETIEKDEYNVAE